MIIKRSKVPMVTENSLRYGMREYLGLTHSLLGITMQNPGSNTKPVISSGEKPKKIIPWLKMSGKFISLIISEIF